MKDFSNIFIIFLVKFTSEFTHTWNSLCMCLSHIFVHFQIKKKNSGMSSVYYNVLHYCWIAK